MQMEKNFFFFLFKRYNLTIRVVKFSKTFFACFPSSLGQELTVESARKFFFFFSFGLLEIEMVVFGCFLRKMATILQGLRNSLVLSFKEYKISNKLKIKRK
jgi:hypothetical protein